MRSVLIVEDDEDSRILLVTLLAYQGIRSTSAADGAEALSGLQSGPLPDLILTDMNMSGMNGAMLLDNLRKDPRTCDIPVILSSGHDDLGLRAKKLDVQGYLSKPYSMASLLALVRVYLPLSPTV